ncbi:MAG: ACP S-malonyltransferase, partial [Acidimicrobiia bacterium]
MTIAWMFPGQGSQRPGMAAELEACKELFQRAKGIVSTDIERISTSPGNTKWPAELLQPAIFTTSVGAAMAIQARGLSPDVVVGHSLGEYAALVVAGVLTFEDALSLVSVRGKGMAAAGKRNPGGMAAVIGLEPEKIEKICADLGDVWVANFNSPSQTVISGRDEALGRAAEEARNMGAMKVIRLEVPMAAHTPLMDSAASDLRAAIDSVTFNQPACTCYSVADAEPHSDVNEIKDLLVRAVIS